MSDKTQTPIVVAPTQAETTEEVVTKQSFLAKSKTYLQNHKKPAIAAGGLVFLVGLSALAGRKSAQYDVNVELEPLVAVPADEVQDESDAVDQTA